MPSYRKKLIEVALPLDAINKESAREKSIRHGHPSTLHLWWARRPLAACRAVLFSQLVDDPSEYMPDEKLADEERQRLFDLIEDLVLWENINNEEVLDRAKLEIARSVARDLGEPVPVGKEAIREFLATKAPPVLDPFAGGGSIPLEAQRLGLRAYASDLNPVAVLINKAMIEIPPKFAGMPPVHPPESKEQQLSLMKKEWRGAEGLAEDVRYYGKWMRDEAYKRIGHLYPPVKITEENLAERPDLIAQGLKPGDELSVIAWLWARTVKCPNPACGIQMPLVRSFAVSTRKGNEYFVEPSIVNMENQKSIRFAVRKGKNTSNGTVVRTGARCLSCNTPVAFDIVRGEAQTGRMSARLMAIVAEGNNKRVYISPINEHEQIALTSSPNWEPDTDLPARALGFRVQLYGMRKHSQLFSQRQLTILTTLSSLLEEIPYLMKENSDEYKCAVKTYLAFTIDRLADKSSTLSWWLASAEKMAPTFTRHALAMVWDYAEMNPFSTQTSNFSASIEWVSKVIDYLPENSTQGKVVQLDARNIGDQFLDLILSTDPPYYDNIGYADLSDFVTAQAADAAGSNMEGG
jgi:putative DNA methylase